VDLFRTLGYVTISEERKFVVSSRLRADFDNGVHYYAMQGHELAVPAAGFAPPAAEALMWHRDNRYLG
jgi:putative restriction endonuclease